MIRTVAGRTKLKLHTRAKKHNVNNRYKSIKLFLSAVLMPTPIEYYSRQLDKFHQVSSRQAMALCPFHLERNRSFSVNLLNGMFFCHACGEKGCSIINFHMKQHNMAFEEAVKSLIGDVI